jgi:hypothetical protein
MIYANLSISSVICTKHSHDSLVPEGVTIAIQEEVGECAEENHSEGSGRDIAVELGCAGEEDGSVTATSA